jgi:hypothetical protein
MLRKTVFVLLFIIFIAHLLFRIFSYRDEYMKTYDAKYWEQRYLQSQWVVPNSTNYIGDDGLYAYSGWEYIQGRDPSTLNAELPPLGKYFIGLSIVLFHNQNIFGIFSGLAVLSLLYWLNILLFKDKLVAFVPVVLFSLEPLFYTQLRAPFLDLLHLTFLLLFFIGLIKKHYWAAMLALGLMASVKASSATFALGWAVSGVYILLQANKKEMKQFIVGIPLSFVAFLFVYFRYFMLGHSLLEFPGLQKWIITFYAIGAKGNPMTVWEMLLSGTWRTWWGANLHVEEWSVLWPVLLTFFIISLWVLTKNFKFQISNFKSMHKLFSLKLKSFTEVGFLLLVLWLSAYLIFLMVVPVWPRYLLLVLPFMYNLAIWLILRSILRR